MGDGAFAGDGFYAAHAGGDAAFRHDLEQADVAGALHMGAAAQFGGEVAHGQHAHFIAVFFAEQHHRAGFLRGFHAHHFGLDRQIVADHAVDHALQLGDLFCADRFAVGEVEAGALRIHQRALLRDMVAQHVAQRRVQEVGGGVVAGAGGARVQIDGGGHAVADGQAAAGQLALVAEYRGLDLLGVVDVEQRADAALQRNLADVADLAAAFGVEGVSSSTTMPSSPASSAATASVP